MITAGQTRSFATPTSPLQRDAHLVDILEDTPEIRRAGARATFGGIGKTRLEDAAITH